MLEGTHSVIPGVVLHLREAKRFHERGHVDAKSPAQSLLQPIPAGDRVLRRPGPFLDAAFGCRLLLVGAAERDPAAMRLEHGMQVLDGPQLVAELRRPDLADDGRGVRLLVTPHLVLRCARRRLQHPWALRCAVARSGWIGHGGSLHDWSAGGSLVRATWKLIVPHTALDAGRPRRDWCQGSGSSTGATLCFPNRQAPSVAAVRSLVRPKELLVKIAVPRETAPGETRVALNPQAVTALIADGAEVLVESRAGDGSFIADAAYSEAGARVVPDAAALYGEAEMVLRVGRPTDDEIGMLRSGLVLIGTLGTLAKPALAERLAKAGVTAISMDAIPRITRAQSMDTLSSQATVGGYKAVLMVAERLPKFMPLLTTAAGTVRPARGIVMGAGVAGLMAIGTARRLGAVVEATDVRPVVKEQAESLGGTFIEVELTDEETANAQTAGG